MSPAAGTLARPLRSDAARNRERLLAAAATVFAEHGLGAGVDEVARAAGVGMGTLYRRFPTKEDLVEALVRDVLSRFVAVAENAAHAPGGGGLELFLRAAAALQAGARGCLPRLWNTPAEHELVHDVRRLIAELLDDAKRHDRVRDEITATDVSVILWSLRGIIETTRGATASAWERHLELLVAGMRPAPQRLVQPPISRRELDELLGPASC